MKKIYLSALALSIGAMLHAQTVLIEDDFESYEAGSYFGGHWSTWTGSDDDNLNIIVSTDQASSGEKSGYLGPQNEDGGQDVLLLMDDVYSTGVVTAEWQMYQPSESVGYFNLQETQTPGESYGFECLVNYYTALNEIEGGNLDDKIAWTFTIDTNTYLFAYADVPLDEWFTVKHVMDFNEGTLSVFVNDEEATYYMTDWGNDWPGPMESFGAFDFFSIAANGEGKENTYYIDDVSIVREGVSGIHQVTKNDNSIKVYPNPATDFVNISAEEVISSVEIYNISGQLVNTLQPHAKSLQVNTGDLTAGVYTAKVIMKNAAFSKEFVVQ